MFLMDLPKINKENLTDQLREVVGDNDLEFESIVDPTDVMILPDNTKEYLNGKLDLARMLVESRNKLEEYRTKSRSENLTGM